MSRGTGGSVILAMMVVAAVESAQPAADRLSIRDLGTLGGLWSAACRVNNRREIVGLSATASGQFRAVLWTRE